MKLVLQIALGVFLGGLAAQLTGDAWRAYRDQSAKEIALKQRSETEERVRALFMRDSQGRTPGAKISPPGFVPEDVQAETSRNQ